MASTVKSSSQKFWHLKKIARKSSNPTTTTTTTHPSPPRSTTQQQQQRHRSLPESNDNAPTASRRLSSPVGKHLCLYSSSLLQEINHQHAFRSIRFQS